MRQCRAGAGCMPVQDGAPSLYDRVGGHAGVREFTERLYAAMERLPQAREVRAMHGDDLGRVVESVYRFLSGWLGGPDLYVASHGPPRLRRKHLAFPIGGRERDQWLLCARTALQEMDLDEDTRQAVYQPLAAMADHLRNQPADA